MIPFLKLNADYKRGYIYLSVKEIQRLAHVERDRYSAGGMQTISGVDIKFSDNHVETYWYNELEDVIMQLEQIYSAYPAKKG